MLTKQIHEGRTIDVLFTNKRGEDVSETHTFYPTSSGHAEYRLTSLATWSSGQGQGFQSGGHSCDYPLPGFNGVDVLKDSAEVVVQKLYEERARALLAEALQKSRQFWYGQTTFEGSLVLDIKRICLDICVIVERSPNAPERLLPATSPQGDYPLEYFVKGMHDREEEIERKLSQAELYAAIAGWDSTEALLAARLEIAPNTPSVDEIAATLAHVKANWTELLARYVLQASEK